MRVNQFLQRGFLSVAIVLGGVLGLPLVTEAEVVRPAPNLVVWTDAQGHRRNLASLMGQPIVLIVAPSPRARSFRAQVGQMKKLYERFAANKLLALAAFTEESGVIRSNIPFIILPDGQSVATALQIEGSFGIAVIGRDGNLDYVTSKVVPAQRLLDIVGNNFAMQEALRRP